MYKKGDQTKTLKENENYDKRKLGNPDQSLKKSPQTKSGIMSHQTKSVTT
jgi:hypothetical protein